MIIWDEEKNKKLISDRNISLEEISQLILNKKYLDILENPSRKEQEIFIIELNDYIYVVPFIIDEDDNIILKTAFPSRKFNNIYGGKKHETS